MFETGMWEGRGELSWAMAVCVITGDTHNPGAPIYKQVQESHGQPPNLDPCVPVSWHTHS